MKIITDKQGKPVNPFDWNYIVFKRTEEKKDEKVKLTKSAQELITNPVTNLLSRFLGIDNKKEFAEEYDKIGFIYDWAKERTGGSDDPNHIMQIVKEKLNNAPQMGNRRIDDLVIAIKLEQAMGPKKKETTDENSNYYAKEELTENEIR